MRRYHPPHAYTTSGFARISKGRLLSLLHDNCPPGERPRSLDACPQPRILGCFWHGNPACPGNIAIVKSAFTAGPRRYVTYHMIAVDTLDRSIVVRRMRKVPWSHLMPMVSPRPDVNRQVLARLIRKQLGDSAVVELLSEE